MIDRQQIPGALTRLLHDVLTEEYGAGAIVWKTFEGQLADPNDWAVLSIPTPVDDLLGTSVELAGYISRVARGLSLDFATKARGAGKTWAEIAEFLDIDPDADDKALEAFRMVAPTPSQRFDEVRVSWKCASCKQAIRDIGPYGGHPDDNEAGHATDCARHIAAVTEYMKEWD